MKIKVGIIGCGSICQYRHAPEYANNPNVQIVAFYDPNKERAEKMVKKYGGYVAESYEEIIEDTNIDAISDCSTNEMHHIVTCKALRNNKHVLCEKPMAISVELAEEMVKTSNETGKILMIDHNQRLAAGHIKAKEILKRGELGRVLTFHTVFGHKGPEYWSINKSNSTWFFNKNRSVLGVAGDLGIHKIDLIRYLLEDEIVEVSSFESTLDKKDDKGNKIEVSDNMICILKTEKGCMGTAVFSWTYYGNEDNSTTLYCEKGIMKIYGDPSYQIIIKKFNGDEILYRTGAIQTNDNQTSTGIIDEFISSILEKRKPLITGEDGLKALKIIFAAMESSKKGIKIRL